MIEYYTVSPCKRKGCGDITMYDLMASIKWNFIKRNTQIKENWINNSWNVLVLISELQMWKGKDQTLVLGADFNLMIFIHFPSLCFHLPLLGNSLVQHLWRGYLNLGVILCRLRQYICQNLLSEKTFSPTQLDHFNKKIMRRFSTEGLKLSFWIAWVCVRFTVLLLVLKFRNKLGTTLLRNILRRN